MKKRVQQVQRVETPYFQYMIIMMVGGFPRLYNLISGEPSFNPLDPLLSFIWSVNDDIPYLLSS
jgi:hypothetical protein